MIKTFAELNSGLSQILPTSYDHTITQPSGDFITFVDNGQDDIFADDLVQVERYQIDVDLNTRQKNETLERQLKDFFRENDIPYEKSDTLYIIEEDLYLTTFSIEIINQY